MSLQQLLIVTDCLPDPSSPDQNRPISQLGGDWSYEVSATNDFTTLSSSDIGPGDSVSGLLYVPDLPSNSSCVKATAPYIPSNVTRQSNLPSKPQQRVAFAPWVNSECTAAFLSQARTVHPVAMLFYLPNNTVSAPPPANESIWSLNDGGAWKAQTPFPVYAISSTLGQAIMTASAAYSGNMTDVPFGHNLTESFDSTDYVRLAAGLRIVPSPTNLPSLWVFLLVVLGILLAIIGLTSMTMHWIQQKRRAILRRRVANGEVDLEALGIKRLTIPQEIINTMPLYTYGTTPGPALPDTVKESSSRSTPNGTSETAHVTDHAPSTRVTPPLVRSTSYHPAPWSQPTCAICLEDFVAAGSPTNSQNTETMIRELPCRHIFHPECVDTFLRDNSSLCPMCKKSALPKGYCPRIITNAMVRRERVIRRMRETVVDTDDQGSQPGITAESSMQPSHWFLPGFISRRTNRPGGPQNSQEGSPWATEMVTPVTPALVPADTRSDNNASPSSVLPAVQPPPTSGRREWARQRAIAMLGRRLAPEDPEAEDSNTKPAWKKALNKIFPSLGR